MKSKWIWLKNENTKKEYYNYYFFDEKEVILDSCNSVLRFFEDNKRVISVPIGLQNKSKDQPIESYTLNEFFPKETWFNETYEDYGTYEVSDNHIKFKCGFVSYEGINLGNILELSTHSDYNGYEAKEIYKFISLEELQNQEINLIQILAANGKN